MTTHNENRGWSSELIKSKLADLDCEDISGTIADVTKIVEIRVFKNVFDKLHADLKNKLKGRTDDEIKEYFELHKEELPQLSIDEVFAIEDTTWSDYFKAIEK